MLVHCLALKKNEFGDVQLEDMEVFNSFASEFKI